MRPVTVVVLHRLAAPASGPLERALEAARRAVAAAQRPAWLDMGAAEVRLVESPPDDTPFGARLRALVGGLAGGPERAGLVVLGAGVAAVARPAELARFLEVAASGEARALANNRYSADLVAVGRPEALRDVPDLPTDNALPRWLEEVAGFAIADRRSRWRLAFDLDSPLDVALAARDRSAAPALREVATALPAGRVRRALDGVAAALADRRAEVLVAGRTSAASIAWLERSTAARIRALVEERGLRASSPLALGEDESGRPARAPASLLGALLDRDGPGALGAIVGRLADAALVDVRVLLAHRLGADEAAWPSAADRFAADLLLPEAIGDAWLRALARSAAAADVPIVLGGHSLVGPGIRLVARRRDARSAR